MTEPSTPAAAPGWYPDHTGHLRWWDGALWGVYAPPSTPPRPSTTAATLSHLGCLLGGFIAPLIVYLVTDKADTMTRDNAREALNFQLTFLVVVIVGIVATFASLGLFTAIDSGLFVGIGALLIWTAYLGLIIANYVLGIMGAIKANRGEVYRYPVRIPFVRG